MFKRNSFVIVFSQKLLSYVLPSEARFKTNVNFILPRKLIKIFTSYFNINVNPPGSISD